MKLNQEYIRSHRRANSMTFQEKEKLMEQQTNQEEQEKNKIPLLTYYEMIEKYGKDFMDSECLK